MNSFAEVGASVVLEFSHAEAADLRFGQCLFVYLYFSAQGRHHRVSTEKLSAELLLLQIKEVESQTVNPKVQFALKHFLY